MTLLNPERFSKNTLPVAILVLIPVLVGLVHDDWLFTPAAYIDPWVNVGFFMHYFDPNFGYGGYKEARVPWLVPGYVLYHTIGPFAANFVLHVGCLVAAAVFVYLALARLVSRNAAFIAAALIAAYYPFQGSGGWDYQTTPAGVFYALTLYLLVRAAQTRYAAFWLGGAGLAFGGLFHSNIIFVNLAPGMACIYLAACRQRPTIIGLCKAVAWVLFGFVLINMLFSVAAWDAGRDPMFFRAMFDLAASYTLDANHQKAWWLPWSSGWFVTPWALAYLLPLATIFLASVIWLIGPARSVLRNLRSPLQAIDPVPVALVGQYAFAFLLWVVWQTLGQTALQPDYFAYPLIIPAFLALGAMLGTVNRTALIGLAATLVLVLVVIDTPLVYVVGRIPNNITAILFPSLIVGSVFVGALFPKGRVFAALGGAFVFLTTYPHGGTTPLWSELRPASQLCFSPKLFFDQMIRLSMKLKSQPDGSRLWLVNGPDDNFDGSDCQPLESFRQAFLNTGTPSLGVFHAKTADITDSEIGQAKAGDRLFAIVKDRSELPLIVDRFKRASVKIAPVSEEVVPLGRVAAITAVYEVK